MGTAKVVLGLIVILVGLVYLGFIIASFLKKRDKPLPLFATQYTDLEYKVYQHIVKIIRTDFHLSVPTEPHSRLWTDLYLDSLDLIEMGMTLENHYKVEFHPDEIEYFENINDIVQHICKKLRSK